MTRCAQMADQRSSADEPAALHFESRHMEARHLLDEQIAYYRARAQEYDEWFLRQGCYDRGPEQVAKPMVSRG